MLINNQKDIFIILFRLKGKNLFVYVFFHQKHETQILN
jgi:hypothetical protein